MAGRPWAALGRAGLQVGGMEAEQEQGRVPVDCDRAGHSTLLSWEAARAPSQLLGTHRVLWVLRTDWNQ